MWWAGSCVFSRIEFEDMSDQSLQSILRKRYILRYWYHDLKHLLLPSHWCSIHSTQIYKTHALWKVARIIWVSLPLFWSQWKVRLSFPPFEPSLVASTCPPFQRFLLLCFCLMKPSHFSGDHCYLLSHLFSLTDRGPWTAFLKQSTTPPPTLAS